MYVRLRGHMTNSVGGTTNGSTTLMTGETVELPLSTDAAITGVVFGASRQGVQKLLPEGLTPIRVAPGRAAVTFLCVDYHRIGAGEFAPYNEFGILLPAVYGSKSAVPLLSAFTRGVGGYVWYLPVTTESARALGVDIWGYPKEVGDITFDDDGTRRKSPELHSEASNIPAIDTRDWLRGGIYVGDRCGRCAPANMN